VGKERFGIVRFKANAPGAGRRLVELFVESVEQVDEQLMGVLAAAGEF
jgi:hypothetical protein